MKKVVLSCIMASSLLFCVQCKDKKQEALVLTEEVTFSKEGELTLKKFKTDSVIAVLDIEIADNEYETQTGLMYRKSMPEDQAMLFIFEDEIPRSFYMKNTEFALDIIYINSNKEIVSIQKNAQPFDKTSLPSGVPVQYVLEVNAGISNDLGIEKGDKIEWLVLK